MFTHYIIKRHLHGKMVTFSSIALRNKYIELKNECKATIMEYNKTIEERLIDSDNVGQFYNYANRKLSCRGGVGLLKDDEGVITDDSQSKRPS